MIDYTNNVRFPRRIHIATILLGVSLFAQAQFTDAPLTGLYPDGSTDNVQAGSVVLNDLEDHNWNYYSGVDMPNGGNTPIRSQNPRDVKIVYYGNGTNTVYYKENTFDRRPQPHRFTLNATTVRVGIKPRSACTIPLSTMPLSTRPTAWRVRATIPTAPSRTPSTFAPPREPRPMSTPPTPRTPSIGAASTSGASRA